MEDIILSQSGSPDQNLKKVNGWNEWAHRVLGDIERIDDAQKDIWEDINNLTVEIAILKTKAAMIGGIWGAIVGIVSSILVAAIIHLLGGK